MRKLLAYGMLLGVFSGLCVAQHVRPLGGGVGSGARAPNVMPISPNAGMNPDAVGVGHGGVLPNATTVSKNPVRVNPQAKSSPTAVTVGPHATGVPDKVITPDAHQGPGPNQ
jgi:hypothetical protein